jgi:hypothetical protein
VSQGKASVIWRESQSCVGFGVTSKWTTCLRSRLSTIRRRAAGTSPWRPRTCQLPQCLAGGCAESSPGRGDAADQITDVRADPGPSRTTSCSSAAARGGGPRYRSHTDAHAERSILPAQDGRSTRRDYAARHLYLPLTAPGYDVVNPFSYRYNESRWARTPTDCSCPGLPKEMLGASKTCIGSR